MLPQYFPWIFLPGFICFFLFVTYVISRFGWARLAAEYSDDSTIRPEKTWRFRYGRVGIVSYKGCLSMGANSSGLFLWVMFPFNFGHKPLFIPWSDVTSTKKTYWIIKTITLNFQRVPAVGLSLPEGLAKEILNFAPERAKPTPS